MRKIDLYSFNCGIIDCFNEIVGAGVKRLAFGAPAPSVEACGIYLDFVKMACQKYGTSYYLESDSLVSDLFPKEKNAGCAHYIFYHSDRALQEYLEIRAQKAALIAAHAYRGDARRAFTYRFGRLLSYTDEDIARKVEQNTSKEPES